MKTEVNPISMERRTELGNYLSLDVTYRDQRYASVSEICITDQRSVSRTDIWIWNRDLDQDQRSVS